MTESRVIGGYRVFYWGGDEPGWIVAKLLPNRAAGEAISKHLERPDAIAAAKRYDAADRRRKGTP